MADQARIETHRSRTTTKPARLGNTRATILMATNSETITLKGGLTVSLEALQLLWRFEARGCVVKVTKTGTLFVGPRHQLTALDVERIRRAQSRGAARLGQLRRGHPVNQWQPVNAEHR